MHVILKWRITYYFMNDKPLDKITLYISDDIYENILRKLADISFGMNPYRIDVEIVQNQTQQSGIGMALQTNSIKY